MNYIFRTLIVPASMVELARQIAASFGPAGENMWITALKSVSGSEVTHYISSGYIPTEFGFMVPLQTWSYNEEGQIVLTSSEPGNPVAVFEAASSQGVDCTQQDIDDLFEASDVTEQEPFVAINRLGLEIVQPDNLV